MKTLKELIDRNRNWAAKVKLQDPEFFTKLSEQQSPQSDFNCLSVIQYAVAVIKVKHIIVCGHYGCGGVQAALGNSQLGLIDNWLRHIKDVFTKHQNILSMIEDPHSRLNRLCELNVIEQVNNICHTTMIQEAWRAGQELSVHGWIYGINNGLLKDLNVCISKQEESGSIYRMATQRSDSDQVGQ